jgi:hypothetical protein
MVSTDLDGLLLRKTMWGVLDVLHSSTMHATGTLYGCLVLATALGWLYAIFCCLSCFGRSLVCKDNLCGMMGHNCGKCMGRPQVGSVFGVWCCGQRLGVHWFQA